MADAVTSTATFTGLRRHEVTLTNESDGTGETPGVKKIDISTFKTANGVTTATYMTVDYIEFQVDGFNYVRLHFDADTDDTLAVLKGSGRFDWSAVGGNTDPQSTGFVGDLLLTTDGAFDGASYTIVIGFRPKA